MASITYLATFTADIVFKVSIYCNAITIHCEKYEEQPILIACYEEIIINNVPSKYMIDDQGINCFEVLIYTMLISNGRYEEIESDLQTYLYDNNNARDLFHKLTSNQRITLESNIGMRYASVKKRVASQLFNL